MNFMDYMSEKKSVDRWFVFKVALMGALCGAALATVFIWNGLL